MVMHSLRVALALAMLAGTTTAAAPRAAERPIAGEVPAIRLVPVTTRGLAAPLSATHAGDGSGRLFVVEQGGRVRLVKNGALQPRPFLDLSGRVLSGGERGLLGLAFHPRFRDNGRFFVNYTRRPDGATVLAEHRVSADPDRALPTGRALLVVPQPFPDHNGGMLAFGPDGRLYVGLGDGGDHGDPGDRAQDRSSLLGKILRLDVDRGSPYAIPPDNPFAAGGGRGEIWALGFRNPWRFSFDRASGRLYAGDVGERRLEEIDLVRRGGNYGWRIMEGNRCFAPATGCDRRGLVLPVAVYAHTDGRCAVTGGYVYRGRAVPALAGAYVHADFCSGEILVLRGGRPGVLLDTSLRIASFGEDEAGELLVVDIGGGVYRLARSGT
ncbi:PQQ-dependent sugar dehydrogenase [Benzoatithermus flavus]|uniref:PQQ-dependent sugar dehydrogenase n=1 Tax=Benzoatithermus flavus TaxID=3108223 RepID=A0ABU8XS97_9PROT